MTRYRPPYALSPYALSPYAAARALDELHRFHDGPVDEDLRLATALGSMEALSRRRAAAQAKLLERRVQDCRTALAARRRGGTAAEAELLRDSRRLALLRRAALAAHLHACAADEAAS